MGICVNDIQFFFEGKAVTHKELDEIQWKLTLQAMRERKFGHPVQLVAFDDEKKVMYFENGLW